MCVRLLSFLWVAVSARLSACAHLLRLSTDFWKACQPDGESARLLDEDEGFHPTVLQGTEGEQ